ncbi:MAG: hypothetical protein ACOC2W_04855 [bacterium]
MSLQIYTAQMNKEGEGEVYDITVKGDLNILAPTWSMVMNYKRGEINERQYTKLYYQLIKQKYKENKKEFHKLIKKNVITLKCYCKAGEFCHRLLAKDILLKIADNLGITVYYKGEI